MTLLPTAGGIDPHLPRHSVMEYFQKEETLVSSEGLQEAQWGPTLQLLCELGGIDSGTL